MVCIECLGLFLDFLGYWCMMLLLDGVGFVLCSLDFVDRVFCLGGDV